MIAGLNSSQQSIDRSMPLKKYACCTAEQGGASPCYAKVHFDHRVGIDPTTIAFIISRYIIVHTMDLI